MGFLGDIGRALGGVARVALPVVGGLVGGPLGAVAGRAISGAIPGGGGGGGGGGVNPAAVLQGGMNAVQAAQAAAQVQRANQMREQAAAGANADYASRDPLRQFAMQQLMQGPEARPDFSSAVADPSNPFASPLARPAVPPPGSLANPITPGKTPKTSPFGAVGTTRTLTIPSEIAKALTQGQVSATKARLQTTPAQRKAQVSRTKARLQGTRAVN